MLCVSILCPLSSKFSFVYKSYGGVVERYSTVSTLLQTLPFDRIW